MMICLFYLMKSHYFVTNIILLIQKLMIYLCHKEDQDAMLKRSQICIIYKLRYSIYQIVNRQLQVLNNRFIEVNTELLLCIACLNPRYSFFAFDNKEKLIQLAQFYSFEFSFTHSIFDT
ncbi:hypothetical protein HN873_012232 [Arachis hypogaea]